MLPKFDKIFPEESKNNYTTMLRTNYVIKNKKRRQNDLSDNHSCLTNYMIGILTKYCKISISKPNKLSTKTIIFPKINEIWINENDKIEIKTIIKNRINEKLKDKKLKNGEKVPRMGFERRFELFEILEDILYEINGLKIIGIKKENGGISGEYQIKTNGKTIQKDEIRKTGMVISKRLYENNNNTKRIKIIEKGSLNDIIKI